MAEKEKKKRVRKEYSDAAASSVSKNEAVAVSKDLNAGEQLRAAREAKGLTLENVASSIHLRVSQIRAMEEGDIGHLPGMAYAVGFVRSYANFLKLNSVDVVARFKADHGGITKIKAELNFPEPVNEGKTPSPMIIGAAAICVVVLLSVWAIFSGGESADTQVENTDVTAISEAPAVDTLPVETEDGFVEADPVAQTTVVETMAPVAEAPVVAPVAEAPVSAAPAMAPVVAQPVISTTVPAKKEPVQAPVPQSAAETEASEPIVVKPPKTRVVLQADQTAWVQVTDAKGNVILKKVMKPGEKFYVPEQRGLSLVTSNAGGVSVVVDGNAIPSLGQDGSIVRNIMLEPESLKARRPSRIRNY